MNYFLPPHPSPSCTHPGSKLHERNQRWALLKQSEPRSGNVRIADRYAQCSACARQGALLFPAAPEAARSPRRRPGSPGTLAAVIQKLPPTPATAGRPQRRQGPLLLLHNLPRDGGQAIAQAIFPPRRGGASFASPHLSSRGLRES